MRSKIIEWLDENQQAEKDEYEDKRKELEQVAMPIMSKLHQGGNPGAQSGGQQQQQQGFY